MFFEESMINYLIYVNYLNMNEILYLLIMSISSVLSLFIIAKLLGKRQIAQLEFVDYVIGISLGSISAEMSTDVSDKPIYYYLIAILIYFLFDIIINFFARKSPKLKHFLKGRPLTLIYNGKIEFHNLKKSRLSVNDLITLAREQGYFDLSNIDYAIFENNGNLTIMPKVDFRVAIVKDLNIKATKAELPYYLIADGKLSYSSLYELKKDKKWLFKKLKINNNKELKNIILAIYNKEEDKIIVNHKN